MKAPDEHRDPNALPAWVWAGYVVLGALCVPWYFSEDSVEPTVWAFPFWAALTVAAFFALAAYTAFVYLKIWRPDAADDEERP